jgi:hypothetical protein
MRFASMMLIADIYYGRELRRVYAMMASIFTLMRLLI